MRLPETSVIRAIVDILNAALKERRQIRLQLTFPLQRPPSDARPGRLALI